ncbi:MAG: hypothetical protein WCL44_15905, partial [bacterium]
SRLYPRGEFAQQILVLLARGQIPFVFGVIGIQLTYMERVSGGEPPRAKLVETGDTSESYVGAGKEKG